MTISFLLNLYVYEGGYKDDSVIVTDLVDVCFSRDSLGYLLIHKNLNVVLKCRVYNTLLISYLLYYCKTYPLQGTDI